MIKKLAPSVLLTPAFFAVVLMACSMTPAVAPTAMPQATPKKTSPIFNPYDEKADAKADIATALSKAGAEHKNVLLNFGANWCPDCVVLSQIFEDEAVKPFLEANFCVVKIDVGNWDKNLDVSETYGNPIGRGIPAVVVLDSEGKVVASTQAGELANARTATKQEILEHLERWAPQKP